MANDEKLKFSLHDLKSVNTVLGMLYDKDGKYRPGFAPEVFYNTILLDTLKYGEENFVHLKYAETVNIRKGEKVARFRRWAGMTPTIRPMVEGIPPAPDKHAYEYMEVGNVFSFGRWSEYTDQIDMSVISEVVSERSVQYGENASQTKELYARKVWLSTPNEFYANFKSGFANLMFGDAITLDDLRFLVARMKRMQVKPISGKFNYICSQEFINGLIDDPRVVQYMKIEQTTGNMWTSGEPFSLFELNFIPTMLDEFAYPDTEFPGVYELSNGHEAIRLYAVDKTNNAIYYITARDDYAYKASTTVKSSESGVSYLADGTAIENKVTWTFGTDATALAASNTTTDYSEDTLDTDTVYVAKSTYTKDSTTGVTKFTTGTIATADYDNINNLIKDGAFMQLPVHRGILFGDEAMIKLNYEGLSDQPRIIIKPLGSTGVMDPLDQRQSIGYRVDGFGLAIKRPEAICVTYGIPANAELAAVTASYYMGDPTILDSNNDSTAYVEDAFGNQVQSLVVSGVNNPYTQEVAQVAIDALNKYPLFKVSTAYSVGDVFQFKGVPYEVTTAIKASGSEDVIATEDLTLIKAHTKVIKDTLFTNLVEALNKKDSNVK